MTVFRLKYIHILHIKLFYLYLHAIEQTQILLKCQEFPTYNKPKMLFASCYGDMQRLMSLNSSAALCVSA